MSRKINIILKILGTALIANLLISSAIYAVPRERGGGGMGMGRSAPTMSAPSMRAPSMGSGMSSFGQRQSLAPSARTFSPPTFRSDPVIRQQAPPMRAEPPRIVAPQRNIEPQRNFVPENRNMNFRQNQPMNSNPPAFQNRNISPPAIRENGINNRQENPPQMNMRGNQQAPAVDRSPVVINPDRASRIGSNIGEGGFTNMSIARENARVNQGMANRENNISSRSSQIAKPIGPQNSTINSERIASPNPGTASTGPGNRNDNVARVTIPQSRTDRIGSMIGQTAPENRITQQGSRNERQTISSPQTRSPAGSVNREGLNTRSLASTRIQPSVEQQKPGFSSERTLTSGVRETSTVRNNGIVDTSFRIGSGNHFRTFGFEDRPFNFRHHDRFEFEFRDRFHAFNSFFIWPSYYCWIGYPWGYDWDFCFFHPYYHRRFIFVSLFGYWPDYDYMRYYWYGYHPYYWYGYDPIPQYYGDDAYNYYTYNYYGTDTSSGYSTLPPVNQNTFADVRAKMQQQAEKKPDAATQADQLFDEAVQAFENANYSTAVDKFAQAMKLAPDDVILPYAYAQSLVAIGQYNQAADVLRGALAKVTPDKESVFFPRGLYANDDVLAEQIKVLTDNAKTYPMDADLQLMLGYQLLGLNDLDAAQEHLNLASQDIRNAPAAKTLLDLLGKIKAKVQSSTITQPNTPSMSNTPDMQSDTRTEMGPTIQSQGQVSSDINLLPMDAKRLEQWQSQYFNTVRLAI